LLSHQLFPDMVPSCFPHGAEPPSPVNDSRSKIVHPLEAGGVLDLLRCSVTVDEPDAIRDHVERMRALTMERDGMELVFVRNDFHSTSELRPHDYRDLQLGIFVEPIVGIRLYGEVRLIMRPWLNIKKHMTLLRKYDDGDYVMANYLLQYACNIGRAALEKKKSAAEDSTSQLTRLPQGVSSDKPRRIAVKVPARKLIDTVVLWR